MPWFFRLSPLLAAMLLLSLPGRAQERPLLAPTHDVSVVLAVTRAGPDNLAHKIRLSYVTDGSKIRIDSYVFRDGHAPFESIIFNGNQNKRFIVIYEAQAYLEADQSIPDLPELVLNETMQFTRQSTMTVANRSCTMWQVTVGEIPGTIFCITDDGVVLRSETPTRVLEATEVTSNVPPDVRFVPARDLRLVRARPPGAAPSPSK
jgi:hypothetical protein